MKVPRPLQNLIEAFEKLPGIGPKTAQRLTYYLLHVPQTQLEDFAKSLEHLKKDTVLCSICMNVAESDPCPICLDINRNKNIILVVEQPLDVLAIEKTGKYKGRYHVLHGSINPLDNIGPDEIYIKQLLDRVADNVSRITEIIIATNPTMEGDATAMYIAKQLKNLGTKELKKMENKQSLSLRKGKWKLEITRLGMGIPTGADLEYADETTLTQALEGRRTL
jgi:recombination protein RecR